MKIMMLKLAGLSSLMMACTNTEIPTDQPAAAKTKTETTSLAPRTLTQATTKKPVPQKIKTPSPEVEKQTIKPGAITGVQMGQLFAMTQSGQVLLIDCRPTLFYRMGHIDGAISLPLKNYAAKFPSVKPQLEQAKNSGKVTVLYCQNVDCPDAYSVAKKLAKLGYNTSIYKGGWEEWKSAGF